MVKQCLTLSKPFQIKNLGIKKQLTYRKKSQDELRLPRAVFNARK